MDVRNLVVPGETRVGVNEGSGAHRLAAWREALGATAQIEIDPTIVATFQGEFRSRIIGPLMATRVSADRFRLSRDRAIADHIRRDNIFINLVTAGRLDGFSNGRRVVVDPGGVILSRHGETQDLDIIDATWLGLVLPKQLVDAQIGWTRWCEGRVFPAGSTEAVLLAHHLQAMLECPHPVSSRDAKLLVRLTITVLGECIGSRVAASASRLKPKRQGPGDIRRFVADHLGDLELGPEKVCAALAISRSSLYRALSESGGLQAMIMSMRLDAVHRDIASVRFPDQRLRAIAERRGIADIRSFRRAFVKAYGYTPSALRARSTTPQSLTTWPHAEAIADIERWFES